MHANFLGKQCLILWKIQYIPVPQRANSIIIWSNKTQQHLHKYGGINLNNIIADVSLATSSCDIFQVDNTYATIQHPTRRGSLSAVMSMGGEDMGDYATLSGGMALHNDGSAHSSIRGTPRNVSTFKFGILCNIYGLKIHSC